MSHGFHTRAIHAGQEPDPLTGAVVRPVYQVSTYKQDGIGGLRDGYEYSRTANPTRSQLEECMTSLEEGVGACAFASGLAAQDALLCSVLSPGDRVLLGLDAYGGTHRQLHQVFAPWGIDVVNVDMSNLDALRAAMTPNTRLIWVETPTNPLLQLADIAAIAEIAHDHSALLTVDNTFATPYLQRPLTLGADAVVHSATKYLGGHSDALGGVTIVNDGELYEKLAFFQNSMGAVLAPWETWLILRGVKTLGVRLEQHCTNAEELAVFLQQHPAVYAVHYPALDEHPQRKLAEQQMRRGGGMISIQLRGGESTARIVCEKTELFTLAESLGGVESLIEHPASMTHASVANTDSAVPADLLRLSVGIENVEDLRADLDQALV